MREREDRELAAAEAYLAAAYLAAARAARRELTEAEVRRLLARGGPGAVARRWAALALARLRPALQARALAAGERAAADIARSTGAPGGLDLSRRRLPDALAAALAALSIDLADSARRAAEEANYAALLRGEDPARWVRASVGLNAAQARALAAMAGVLDRRGPPDEGEEDGRTSPAAILEAYRGRLSSAAAAAVGLALAQRAIAVGESEAAAQSLEDGEIEPPTWEWVTARDERVRPSHRAMHGQVRPDGEPFRSGDGNLLRYPHDPSAPLSDRAGCRCRRRLRAGAVARPEVA